MLLYLSLGAMLRGVLSPCRCINKSHTNLGFASELILDVAESVIVVALVVILSCYSQVIGLKSFSQGCVLRDQPTTNSITRDLHPIVPLLKQR